MSNTYPGFDKLPIPCVDYITNILPKELADIAVDNLLKECKFLEDEQTAVLIMGKRIPIPRKQVGYGEGTYSFSGTTVRPFPWSEAPTLEKIKDIIVEKTGYPVTYCLVNHYRNGDDYIGYHSDDEKELSKDHPIISVSLGAERVFRLRHKVTGVTYEKLLEHNSMTLMNPPCQKVYKHSVPKTKKIKTSRINLTFRILVQKKKKSRNKNIE